MKLIEAIKNHLTFNDNISDKPHKTIYRALVPGEVLSTSRRLAATDQWDGAKISLSP